MGARLANWLLISFLIAASLPCVRASDEPGPMSANASSRASTRPVSSTGSIRIDVQAILVPVTVADAAGRPIPNLKKDDFRIYEDGARQEIVSLSSVDVPVSIVIVFDASSSMSHKLAASISAVDQFFKISPAGDEFLLVRFSDHPTYITGFTTDGDDISGWLHTTRPHGLTALNDAVYMGIQQMKTAQNGRKVLLVLSDGGDNNSAYSGRQLQELVQESDVQIYSLSIFERSRLLEKLSGETGGTMFAVHSIADLPDAMERLSRAIHSRYVLTYYSSNSRNDGKFRRVTVGVGNPELRVSWRHGYYAPLE
jgi:Ca-activated chloride channel family protein